MNFSLYFPHRTSTLIKSPLAALLFTLSFLVAWSSMTYAETQTENEKETQYKEWAQSIWNSLDPQTGEIKLAGDVATLTVPDNFYYLSSADTEKVLVEVWGNPPGGSTLGMLFPKKYTPFDADAWGVTVSYEEDGYVSDENADSIDYDDLLEQMKSDVKASSEQRIQQGYESIALLGWAERPHYDSTAKKMYWAKELEFGGEQQHTLNYNIRVLGRKGVLVLNFIAGMPQLQEISSNLDPVLTMANFDTGFRYEDFDPDLDEVAAYGLGALIAGKVLAKTGVLVMILLALKKFWILGAVALFGFVKVFFRRGKKDAAEE
ncbi:MAG: DUF2167 domain-containing protein [Motiliproteus sp.]